jgi:mono/diheme cytochrome c family protein
MKLWLKRLLLLAAALLAIFLLLLAAAWWNSESARKRTFAVADPPLPRIADAVAALAQGAHIYKTRGCGDCHGEDAAGKLVFEAGPVIRLVAPNITRGGRGDKLSDERMAAAIRHGVDADGHPLVFMPVGDYQDMGDEDTAALVHYIRSLPSSGNDPGALEIRPLARVLYLFGKFPLLPAEALDHSPRARATPVVAADAAYGRYLARGCTGCHGEDFAGQHVPGTPPEFPDAKNLTPAGMGSWSQADFRAALRTGKRPDGSTIDEFMPWRTFAAMSDTELDALWLYLSSLPPVQEKKAGE